jgi:hypothetical protein
MPRLRSVFIVCLWVFLVWLGWSAVGHHTAEGDFLLSLYVFLGATGVSVFLWRI